MILSFQNGFYLAMNMLTFVLVAFFIPHNHLTKSLRWLCYCMAIASAYSVVRIAYGEEHTIYLHDLLSMLSVSGTLLHIARMNSGH